MFAADAMGLRITVLQFVGCEVHKMRVCIVGASGKLGQYMVPARAGSRL